MEECNEPSTKDGSSRIKTSHDNASSICSDNSVTVSFLAAGATIKYYRSFVVCFLFLSCRKKIIIKPE